MSTPPVSLIDVSTYLPGEPIPADYYAQFAESDDLRDNVMFRAPKFRHHVGKDETAVDMIERAVAGLIARHGEDAVVGRRRVDDAHPAARHSGLRLRQRGRGSPWHAAGVGFRPAQRRMCGVRADDEAGPPIAGIRCGQFRAARAWRRTPPDRSSTRKRCAARHRRRFPGTARPSGLVTLSDRSPILDVECRTYGEYAADMTIAFDVPRKYWEAGPGEGCVGFTEGKITKVLARGNRLVPEVAYAVCDRIGMKPKELDMLVTNQPNRVFLRNWREALELPPERHVRYVRGVRQPVRRRHPDQPGPCDLRRSAQGRRRGDDGRLRARR